MGVGLGEGEEGRGREGCGEGDEEGGYDLRDGWEYGGYIF